MASRKVNEAVVAFRKQVTAEYDVDQARREVEARIERLSSEEFAEYMAMTQQIEVAASKSEETAEEVRWSPATRRQQFKIAVNAAGKDGA
jgi:hypothetical protein